MKTAVISLVGVGLMLCAFAIAYLREEGFTFQPIEDALLLFSRGTAAHTAMAAEAPSNLIQFPGNGASAPVYQYTPEPGQQTGELLLTAENLLQNPELPNGCEATSLAIALRYLGYYADNVELAYNYIPREDFTWGEAGRIGPDPNTAYAGDPAKADGGYYCLAPALTVGAQYYLDEQYADETAKDVTGISNDGLIGLLQGGSPVIVWSTMYYNDAQYCETGWTLPGGGYCLPYANLHCMVLVGHTEDDFILCNPLQEGLTYVSQKSFTYGFEALGRQAVVLN